MNWKTTKDMYNYAKDNNMKLLSNFSSLTSTFWNEYIANYSRYDKIFSRMFYSFRYVFQEEAEPISDIVTDFTEDVYNFLLINEKKFDELYRIKVVDDDDYSILDNYNVVETMDRDTTDIGSHTDGARSDSSSYTSGSQLNTTDNKVSPYDTEELYNAGQIVDNVGQKLDSASNSKGEQINSHNVSGTEDYTLTRKGNIGVKTATEIMKEHKEFWSVYDFYVFIFKEISKEMLLV